MNRKGPFLSTKQIVILLVVISIIFYALQIIIFRDPKTTAFYIFQDLGFLPLSIAIATIVVGEVLDEREKRERLHKTRMLTSSFFTEIGAALMVEMISAVPDKTELVKELGRAPEKDTHAQALRLSRTEFSVSLNEETYLTVIRRLQESKIGLMVLATSPILQEEENFSKMLWGLFHIMDEYRLRGDFSTLSEADLNHVNEDFERALRLLLRNWVENNKFLLETFPNFYTTATTKLLSNKWDRL